MTYNADLNWSELSKDAAVHARQLQGVMRDALNAYDEWQNFRNSRDNATIATALGRTTAEVAEMDSCFSAFKEIYDFANNVASPSQGDRLFSMRKFS